MTTFELNKYGFDSLDIKKMRIKYLLLIIVLFIYLILSASPKIEARTAILMDYNSGEILHELEADQNIYPASMTKIMTAIVAFDFSKR